MSESYQVPTAASPPDERKPLWEVMETAYTTSSGTFTNYLDEEELPGPDREEFSAMIRAVRDWLVPEEDPLPDSLYGGNRFTRQRERMRLRTLLTAEADRAERGDG